MKLLVSSVVERRNVTVVAASSNPAQNSHLLSPEEEKKKLRTFDENKSRLRVPRRAPWKKSMTKQMLDRQEKDGFLEWRRGLAE
jgi:tRNA splicing ligase